MFRLTNPQIYYNTLSTMSLSLDPYDTVQRAQRI